MANAITTLATLKHVGGHPALDFVNTVHHWIGTGPERDYLGDYVDLLRLSRDIGLLDARESRVLARAASVHPAAANKACREAQVLRHALHEILQAYIEQRGVDADEARTFDACYRRAACALGTRVDRRGRIAVDWMFDELPLELPLLKLAWAAVQFMLAVEPGRLKQCPAEPGCGWMFHDTSKNRSRRWCDMTDCGNIAKSRRHYARVRKTRRRPAQTRS